MAIINYIQNQSVENIQISPFFIFQDLIEFQNYKFRSIYVFLEALKISDEKKRQDLLKTYQEVEAIKELYRIQDDSKQLNYSKAFNKKSISKIIFNNEELEVESLEFEIFLNNVFKIVAANSLAFKYSLLNSKKDINEFPELDQYTSLGYLNSDRYWKILRNVAL